MNKRKKNLIISTSIITSIITIPLITTNLVSCSCSYHSNNSDNQKINILSSQIVNNNFKSNGIWENKKFISSQDLAQYDEINIDAFNSIPVKLDYIELNSDTKITGFNPKQIKLTSNNFIFNWTNINEIRIKTISNSKEVNLISHSGIIYFNLGLFEYIPVSLTNKTQHFDLLFPTTVDTVFSNKSSIWIPDNFFSIFNCNSTIKSISFTNPNSEYSLISNIGKNSFENCMILNQDLRLSNISVLSKLSIDSSAFKNTNIRSLNINYYIANIGQDSFSDNRNLTNITTQVTNLYISDRAFSNCNTNFSMDISKKIGINNNFSFVFNGVDIFKNSQQYTSFILNINVQDIDPKLYLFEFVNNSLTSLNASINKLSINLQCFLVEYQLSDFNDVLNYLKHQILKSGLNQSIIDNIQALDESNNPIY